MACEGDIPTISITVTVDQANCKATVNASGTAPHGSSGYTVIFWHRLGSVPLKVLTEKINVQSIPAAPSEPVNYSLDYEYKFNNDGTHYFAASVACDGTPITSVDSPGDFIEGCFETIPTPLLGADGTVVPQQGIDEFLVLVEPIKGPGGWTFVEREYLSHKYQMVDWWYYRNGGCGSFQLLTREEFPRANQAVRNGWEIHVKVRLDGESSHKVWYRGTIRSVDRKYQGEEVNTLITGQGYLEQLANVQVQRRYPKGLTIKQIVDDIITTYVKPDTRIIDTAKTNGTDPSDYVTEGPIHFECSALRAIKFLAELQGNREFGVAANREFYFRQTQTVFKDALIMSNDIVNVVEGGLEVQKVNKLKVTGKQWGHKGTDITHPDITDITQFGLFERPEEVPWVEHPQDAKRWAENIVNKKKNAAKYRSFGWGQITKQLERNHPDQSIAPIRIYGRDVSNNFEDFNVTKIHYIKGGFTHKSEIREIRDVKFQTMLDQPQLRAVLTAGDHSHDLVEDLVSRVIEPLDAFRAKAKQFRSPLVDVTHPDPNVQDVRKGQIVAIPPENSTDITNDPLEMTWLDDQTNWARFVKLRYFDATTPEQGDFPGEEVVVYDDAPTRAVGTKYYWTGAEWVQVGGGGSGQITIGDSIDGGTPDCVVYLDSLGQIATNTAFRFDGTDVIIANDVIVSGQVRAAAGTDVLPGIAIGDTAHGFYASGDDIIYAASGIEKVKIPGAAGNLALASDVILAWHSGTDLGTGSQDTYINRSYQGAGTVGVGEVAGAVLHTLSIYRTFTNSGNWERLRIGYISTDAYILSEAAGSGTTRRLRFGTSSAEWEIQTAGHWVDASDNTHDIGNSLANRPRNLYLGRDIFWASQTGFQMQFAHSITATRVVTFPDVTMTVSGGTGANDQVAVWNGTNTQDGSANLTFASGVLTVTGNVRITGTTAQSFLELDDGQTVTVSAAGEAKLRYNDSTGTLQVSLDGASFVDLSTGGGGVTGSGANDQVAIWSGATSLDGSASFTFNGTTIGLGTSVALSWNSDTTLIREGDGILALGNTGDFTTRDPQEFRVYQYNEVTDLQHERLAVRAQSSAAFQILTEAAGNGQVRNLEVGRSDSYWQFTSTAFRPSVDNSYDIGDGTVDPRTVNAATSVNVGGGYHTLTSGGAVVVNETGDRFGDFRAEADGSRPYMLFVKANSAEANIALLTTSEPSWSSMILGIFQGDVSSAPGANPTGGFYHWSGSGGIPTWRTVAGSILTFPDTTGTIVVGSGADNQVATFSGTNSIDSSANLTFDGTRLNVGGTPTTAAGQIQLSGSGATGATLYIDQTDAIADEKMWLFGAAAGQLLLDARSDDNASFGRVFRADRSGTTVNWFEFYSQIRWSSNNTYDIGASGANSPRSIYWGTQLLGPDGSEASPPYSFASYTSSGIRPLSASSLSITLSGTDRFSFASTTFGLRSDGVLGWSATTDPEAAKDVVLVREGDGILALGNAGDFTNHDPQEFRIYNYNEVLDAQHERLAFRFSGNVAFIRTEAAGNGVYRELRIGTGGTASLIFQMGGTDRWSINTSSHLIPSADNSYDFGVTGTNRVRSIYAATSVQVEAGYVRVAGSTSQPFVEFDDGVDVTVSASGEGRIRYNDTAKAFQASVDAGAWTNITGGITGSGANDQVSVWSGTSTQDGSANFTFNGSIVGLGTSVALSWNSDTTLIREGDGILALGNTGDFTTHDPQEFRIYNYNEELNLQHERASFAWASNVFEIHTQQAGNGTARTLSLGTTGNAAILLQTNDVNRWQVVGSTGHLLASSDNTYDIGANLATRPRTGYFGTSLRVGPYEATVVSGDVEVFNAATARFVIRSTTNDVEAVLIASSGSEVSFGSTTDDLLTLRVNNTVRWRVETTGHLTAQADNTYDFGASGANRARNIYFGTQALGPDGAAGTPAYSFASTTNAGMYFGSSMVTFANGGNGIVSVRTDGLGMETKAINWGATLGSQDVQLERDEAAFLALHDDGDFTTHAPVGLRVYNYREVAGAQYERGFIRWTSNVFSIGTEQAGNGVARNVQIGVFTAGATTNVLDFVTANTARWRVDGNGHLIGVADSSYDIGATGATRPRTGYFATSVEVEAGYIRVAGSTSQPFIEFDDGQAVGVSAAGEGRIRYNNSTTAFEQSVNGGSWTGFGGGGGITGSGADNQITVFTGASTVEGLAEFTYDSSVNTLALSKSVSGGQVYFHLENTSNTATSSARLHIEVGGGTADDPFIHFEIPGGVHWTIGADNDVTDNFVIARSATLGTSNAISINASNTVTISEELNIGTATGATAQGDLFIAGPSASWELDDSARSVVFENNGSAADLVYHMENFDTGLGSDTILRLTAHGADPFIHFEIAASVTNWCIGIDNSDGDVFAITQSTSPASSRAIEIAPTTRTVTITEELNVGLTTQATTQGSFSAGSATEYIHWTPSSGRFIIVDSTPQIVFDDIGSAATEKVWKLQVDTNTNFELICGTDAYANGSNVFYVTRSGTAPAVATWNLDGVDMDFVIEGDTLPAMFMTEGNAASENIVLLGTTTAIGWNSMDRGIFIGNSTTAPTGNPSAGGYLYVVAGALTWRGSSGTVTTIAAADPHCPNCGRDFTTQWANGPECFAVCMPCMVGALDEAGISRKKYMIKDQLV